jgi:hypothetical protein
MERAKNSEGDCGMMTLKYKRDNSVKRSKKQEIYFVTLKKGCRTPSYIYIIGTRIL